jgi:proline iminopeptidase
LAVAHLNGTDLFYEVAVPGHSFGGFIALEYALRHPERISHLILLDAAPNLGYGEEIEANAGRKGATRGTVTTSPAAG